MMSIHLPPSQNCEQINDTTSDYDTDSDHDQAWDDWTSDTNVICKSLFDEEVFPTLQEAIAHDRENYNFVLDDVCRALSLDFYGRVRLINFIRKNKVSPSGVLSVTGSEPWFGTNEYLVPVQDNDPFIQLSTETWSDSEDSDLDTGDADQKVRALEEKLSSVQKKFEDYRNLVTKRFDIMHNADDSTGDHPARDDDSHYFGSYEANDIHAVMIQDKVRTATYANFILKAPGLFRDAIVLDVGCGTGILSLFAARAGAKRVVAVDASQIATKAEKIVKANGLENVITVVHGKIEDVRLPDGIEKVDIIVSEWMGYALLYESMLDSVLIARDRFLKPGGIMAPSQSQMMLGLCDATGIWKERIGFWEDVYGFDMSTMSEELYDEAIIDVVSPESLLCKPYVVKDLILSDISSRELDFSTRFTLVSHAERRTKVSAFVLYFDTFFSPSGRPIPPSTEVDIVKEGEVVLAELWPVGGKPAQKRRQSLCLGREKITSFSTGPKSTPTHWKQTIFVLREPFMVSEGSVVVGRFSCRKRDTNSRELNIEVHYSVKEDSESQPGDTIVQIFKVQ